MSIPARFGLHWSAGIRWEKMQGKEV
jgi:hypothetical protein